MVMPAHFTIKNLVDIFTRERPTENWDRWRVIRYLRDISPALAPPEKGKIRVETADLQNYAPKFYDHLLHLDAAGELWPKAGAPSHDEKDADAVDTLRRLDEAADV